MPVAFQQDPNFAAVRDEYFGSEDAYIQLEDALEADPEKWPIIPGTHGVRKARHPDPRRGKGKRGGLRVLYLYVPAREMIVLLDVYDKDEAEDITPTEKKLLAASSQHIRAELMR